MDELVVRAGRGTGRRHELIGKRKGAGQRQRKRKKDFKDSAGNVKGGDTVKDTAQKEKANRVKEGEEDKEDHNKGRDNPNNGRDREEASKDQKGKERGSRDSAGRVFNGGTAKGTVPKEDKEQQTILNRHNNRTRHYRCSSHRPQQVRHNWLSGRNSEDL